MKQELDDVVDARCGIFPDLAKESNKAATTTATAYARVIRYVEEDHDRQENQLRMVDVPVEERAFDVHDQDARDREAAHLLGTDLENLASKRDFVQWFLKEDGSNAAAFVVYRPQLFPNRILSDPPVKYFPRP